MNESKAETGKVSSPDRVTELLAANSRIVLKGRDLKRQLEKVRDQFAHYGVLHRAKNTHDGDLKAEANENMVTEIQKTLNDYHVIELESNLSAS